MIPAPAPHVVLPDSEHHVMVDQPLALVAAMRAMLATWP
jgi:pimeloyl-ACP methyl ester carboxylesterase